MAQTFEQSHSALEACLDDGLPGTRRGKAVRVSALPWRWFGVDEEDGEPDWLAEVRDAVALISHELVWVDEVQARWSDQPGLPGWPRADHQASHRHWLVEEQRLRPIRGRLEQLGFSVVGEQPPSSACAQGVRIEAPNAISEGRLERAWQPWRSSMRVRPVADGVEPPFPLAMFDAYDDERGIALRVEWESEPWPHFADREISAMDSDIRYLVLARRWRRRRGMQTFAVSEHILTALFGDPRARANIAATLPLRGVLLVGI